MGSTGKLSDKVAIVTGGGGGFGEGIVAKFITEGANVLILDINESNAKKVAASHPAGRAAGLKADVSSITDWENALKVVLSTFGKLDIVVNNAGVTYIAGSSIETSEATYDHVFNVNMKHLFYSCKVIIPYFLEKGEGSFVNISSVSASRPRAGLVWYGASKAGVCNATRALAQEWADKKIRFNAICPVAGETGMVPSFLGGKDTPEARQKVIAGIPLGRFALPADIGNAAAFLASDDSNFITGVILDVDGGRSI